MKLSTKRKDTKLLFKCDVPRASLFTQDDKVSWDDVFKGVGACVEIRNCFVTWLAEMKRGILETSKV